MTQVDGGIDVGAVAGAVDEEGLVALTSELAQFPSHIPDEGELGVFLHRKLMDFGCFDEVRLQPVVPGRFNVIATLRGRGGGRNLLLNGHTDVPLPTGRWTRDPYSGTVEDGLVHGVGLTDMKGAIASMAYAGLALASAGEAVDRRGDLVFSAVIHHNVCGLGTRFFLSSWDRPIHAAINGEPTDLHIQVAHGGAWQFQITTRGKAAHLSRRGVNAITKMVRVIDALDVDRLTYDPARMFPPVDPRLEATAPSRSGLYWFHLKDQQGRHTSWPWVVSPAKPNARIAVLASTLTWNAYNDWGGRSNYTAATELPAQPSVFSHQEDVWYTDPFRPPWDSETYAPLSFDRPEPGNAVLEDEEITDPMVSRGAEHIAPAEWRLLGWLEREGFAHDVWADAQLATGEVPLDAYDVLIISTHPEYWTTGMVEAVEHWVTRDGGRLAYLGGNGLNCAVELIDGGERMSVVNGDWQELAPDPASRMEHAFRSEAGLLGVVTTMTGYETGAPYRVLDAGHWAFAGTGLRNGDLFGHRSLDRRAVGGASRSRLAA